MPVRWRHFWYPEHWETRIRYKDFQYAWYMTCWTEKKISSLAAQNSMGVFHSLRNFQDISRPLHKPEFPFFIQLSFQFIGISVAQCFRRS